MSLSKNINPSLVLVQPRKTRPFITERLLMGRKESNLTNKTCLKRSLKEDQKWIFKTDYRLMQVKSIAECSKRTFYNTFDLHKATICHKDLCFVYF